MVGRTDTPVSLPEVDFDSSEKSKPGSTECARMECMKDATKHRPTPIGATVPDLILRVLASLASPFLVIPLLVAVADVIALIGFGFIELSWGDGASGLRRGKGVQGLPTLIYP
jgi:hypothetical protein